MKEVLKCIGVIILVAVGNLCAVFSATLLLCILQGKPVEVISESTLFVKVTYLVSIVYSLLIILKFRRPSKFIFAWKKCLFYLLLAVIFSLIWNYIIFCMTKPTLEKASILLLIETGILGPILEEYLYRGYILEKLETVYETKQAMCITTILFAVSHLQFLTMIYAFILGTIFMLILKKEQSLKYTIFFHIIVNMTALLLPPLLF